MLDLDQVLVVDGCRFVRDLLVRLMKRHSNDTRAIGDCREARRWIEANPGVSLVICDLEAPGGGGLELLEFVTERRVPRPKVLLVGSHFDAAQRRQALELGAVGCLTRPLSFGAIARVLAAARPRPFETVAPRCHVRPPARMQLLDPEAAEQRIAWNVHDLSSSGALIDTRGPIPVGTPLRVALSIGEQRLRLDCQVVRVQEPAWETLPGVAVRFVDVAPDQRAALEREIRRIGPGRR